MQQAQISSSITGATGLGESLSATAAAAGLVIKGLQGLTPVVGSDFNCGFRGLSVLGWHSAVSAGRCFGFGEVEADGVLELKKCHRLPTHWDET